MRSSNRTSGESFKFDRICKLAVLLLRFCLLLHPSRS
jgi:hypothetical protein